MQLNNINITYPRQTVLFWLEDKIMVDDNNEKNKTEELRVNEEA